MLRSEVVLSEELKLLLDSLAFIKSRKTKKRISRSSLIRECILYWWNHKGIKELSDSEMILLNPTLLDDIKASKKDLKAGREYSHEEMLAELEK